MPLLWLSLAFIAGIILASVVTLPLLTWIILIAGFILLEVARPLIHRTRFPPITTWLAPPQLPVSIPILLLALSLGAARYQASLPDLSDPNLVAAYNQSESQMLVTGLVDSPPEVRDKATYLRVAAESMHPDGELDPIEVQGLVLVSTDIAKEFQYGDRVRIRGFLEAPPEDESFSYRDYLARQKIYTLVRNAKVTILEKDQGKWLMGLVYKLKCKALENVYQLWPDPEASLFAGILLGVEYNIPESVQEAFQETGTSHMIDVTQKHRYRLGLHM